MKKTLVYILLIVIMIGTCACTSINTNYNNYNEWNFTNLMGFSEWMCISNYDLNEGFVYSSGFEYVFNFKDGYVERNRANNGIIDYSDPTKMNIYSKTSDTIMLFNFGEMYLTNVVTGSKGFVITMDFYISEEDYIPVDLIDWNRSPEATDSGYKYYLK